MNANCKAISVAKGKTDISHSTLGVMKERVYQNQAPGRHQDVS